MGLLKNRIGHIAKISITIVIFIGGLFLLLYNLYYLPPVKDRYPWLDNQIQAWQYERLSKSFPADDYRKIRYKSIADQLRKGEHDYQFNTGPIPSMK
jgi:hypothetical protein